MRPAHIVINFQDSRLHRYHSFLANYLRYKIDPEESESVIKNVLKVRIGIKKYKKTRRPFAPSQYFT